MIRGRERPDEVVILGNHRDAWIYGGVDPSSGSAALMELARTLGQMVRTGWRPKRSILFASWDAEEFTLTSSTEWGEQHERSLMTNAVAYLNVDSAASGPNFSAAAVPALNRLITDVASEVQDPKGADVYRGSQCSPASRASAALCPTGGAGELVNNRLGSGSDYTVFLNFLGVPDRGSLVRRSVRRLSLHLRQPQLGRANRRSRLPLPRVARADLGADGDAAGGCGRRPAGLRPVCAANQRVRCRGSSANGREMPALSCGVREAARELGRAAAELNAQRDTALSRESKADIDALNRRLLAVERAFLEREGIPGRPWYRHQIYAPKFTYAPELLPAVSEALDAGDQSRAAMQATRLAETIRRAAATLRRETALKGWTTAAFKKGRRARTGRLLRPAAAATSLRATASPSLPTLMPPTAQSSPAAAASREADAPRIIGASSAGVRARSTWSNAPTRAPFGSRSPHISSTTSSSPADVRIANATAPAPSSTM